MEHVGETCVNKLGGKTERDNLENKDIDGRIILKQIFKNRVKGPEINLSVLE